MTPGLARIGIAARLYCVAVLSVGAVGMLAWTSKSCATGMIPDRSDRDDP
jgi:hypothetical protein